MELITNRRKPKILLQYLSLIHYRKSLFTRLFNDDSIEFRIVCGKDSPYRNMRNFSIEGTDRIKLLDNFYFSIGSHRFTWQRKISKYLLKESPDLLILLGMDPHILSNFCLFILAKIKGIKLFWWGHATFGKTTNKMLISIRKFFYKNADGVLVYDQNGFERMKSIGVDPEKITVLWNCINDEDLTLNKKKKEENRLTKLVFSGRIEKRKNLDIIIRAMDFLRGKGNPVVLNIIGDGPYTSNLHNLVSEYKLNEYVYFHGARYGEEALDIIKNSDIGVVPNAAGLSLIHYMGNGLPVLCSNNMHSHGPEIAILADGSTGFFFEENDIFSLVQRIEDLSRNIEEYSENCIEIIRLRYNSETVYLNFKNSLRKLYTS